MLNVEKYDLIDSLLLGGLLAVVARLAELQPSAGFFMLVLILAGVVLGWKSHVVYAKRKSGK